MKHVTGLEGRLAGPHALALREELSATLGALEQRLRTRIAAGAERAAARALPVLVCSVLVTAGGTREPVDAVRVLANRSSGKQGYAVAEEAAAPANRKARCSMAIGFV